MRSSTSSSDPHIFQAASSLRDGTRRGRWAVALLILVAAWVVAVELFACYGVPRLSRIQHRTMNEYHAAVAPPGPPASPGRVLFVGNSLLAAALDLSIVGPALHPEWQAQRFVVESTGFLDWYFGLRRLFSDGARPETVVMMLDRRQLVATSIRGEYFAHYMMKTTDFFQVVRALQLHPTAASTLLAGRLSAFYGTRVEIRKVALGHLIPGAPELTSFILNRPDSGQPDARFDTLVAERLGALVRLCAQHRVRLVFVVAPTRGNTYSDKIEAAGATLPLDIIPAPRSGELQASDYQDGFHLNTIGARKYSVQFANILRQRLRLPPGRAANGEQTNRGGYDGRPLSNGPLT
jgi:hypothetical protein